MKVSPGRNSRGEVGRPHVVAIVILAMGVPAVVRAQQDPAGEPPGAEAPVGGWSGRASLSRYFMPEQANFLLFTGAADRGPLHLEARYDYEDLETGSLFVGWNLRFGDELRLQVVPMFGGVAGRTSGVAPALELALGWGPLEYYLETEVVFDVGDASSSYFYAWSQLTASPADWLHAGIVVQRTRVIRTDREITPGVFGGVSVGRFDVTFYLFDPGADGQYASLSVGVRL